MQDMVPGSKLSFPHVKADQDSGLLIYFQMLTCGKDALAASFDLAHIKGLFWKLKWLVSGVSGTKRRIYSKGTFSC